VIIAQQEEVVIVVHGEQIYDWECVNLTCTADVMNMKVYDVGFE